VVTQNPADYSIGTKFAEAVVLDGVYSLGDNPVIDAATGRVTSSVPEDVMRAPGIYQVDWVINKESRPAVSQRAYLVVERSLLLDPPTLGGPPLIRDVQRALADIPEKNETGEAEFTAEDLLLALLRPIRNWNETPPDLGPLSSRRFPWTEFWLKGAAGYLLRSAAAHYRRNRFPTNAGGLVVDDKDKENPYMQASQVYLAEWNEFLLRKKTEINISQVWGESTSMYEAYGPNYFA
jgi:hypothetical protein